MNRAKVKNLREKLQTLINDHWDDDDIEVSIGNASFTSNDVVFKVTMFERDAEVSSKAEADFKQYAAMFGLNPDDYGHLFIHGGKVFELCGIKPSARRYPILAKETAGEQRVCKFTPSCVEAGLKLFQEKSSNVAG